MSEFEKNLDVLIGNKDTLSKGELKFAHATGINDFEWGIWNFELEPLPMLNFEFGV